MKNEMTEVITAFYDEDAEHGDMWWWRSGAGPFPDTEDLPTTPYARIPDTIPPADAAVVSKEDADRIAGLESEIKAYDLRMDNDAKRIDELEAELATVKESLTTANATIDKLPKTADGVPVVPKMTVYALHDGCIEPAVVSDFWDWDSDEYEWDDGPGVPCRLKATQWKSIYLSWCYSTREAALAAKGGK